VDPNEKRELRERFERIIKKHHRTRDEEKRIQNEARARKAGQKPKRRHRGFQNVDEEGYEDDGLAFEKIRREPGRRPGTPTAPVIPPSPLEIAASARSGRVVEVHRNRIRVRMLTEGVGERLELDVSPSERIHSLVVGDRVWVDGVPLQPRLVGQDERRSSLSRPGAHPGDERVLAANVDLGVIVCSLRRPDLRPGLIHRVLIALSRGGVEPVLALNKVDLLAADERADIERLLAAAGLDGALRVYTSAETGAGLDELRGHLRGRTCVLVGHSGVGKSSLLNVLRPGTEQSTATGREFDGKGRHTTTSSSLWELEDGTCIIDTPGVRSFGVGEVERADLAAAFPEIERLAQSCRFADCRHADEPDCAVRAAVTAGDLPTAVLAAYRSVREPSD
jgi:ribosome biogenesis GTPase